MSRLATSALLVVLTASCWKTTSGQAAWARFAEPIVVLRQTPPPGPRIDPDEPDFVIYSSGQVIYKSGSGNSRVFHEQFLSHASIQRLIFDLDLTDSLIGLPDQVMASTQQDEPFTTLILNVDTVKSITVYGNLSDPAVRQRVPKSFLEAYDRIRIFGNSEDKVWEPERFEVVLFKDSSRNSHPVAWPPGWPDLKDSASVKRRPDLYNLFMDRSQFHEFLNFIGKLKPGQDVELDQMTFMISWRFPFPNLQ